MRRTFIKNNLFIWILAVTSILTGCTKKDTAAQQEKNTVEITDEHQVTSPETSDQNTAGPVKENSAEMEKKDSGHKDLAINPDDCTVTHCNQSPGFEGNGLICDTQNIVDAGFMLGSKVFRIGHIERSGKDCVYAGEKWEKCFLSKKDYVAYIESEKLDCSPDDTECLYEGACSVREDDDYDVGQDMDIPQDGTIEEKMAGLKWQKGYVSRFDFDFEAPAFMKEMPAPDNNDGSTYLWKDMSFKVWGAHDMYDGSVKKAYDESVKYLGHEPHYKVVKSNYYIISDFDENHQIFYKKCILKWELEFCEIVTYPEAYKEAVDPIVKKVSVFDVTKEPDMDAF